MKKLLIGLLILVAGLAFGNSITSESAYDLDARTFSQSLLASLAAGPVTVSLGAVVTQIPDAPEIDMTANVAVILGIMTIQVVSSYGIDSVDMIPLTITAGFKLSDRLKVSTIYGFDNINGEMAEIGKITAKIEYSF